MRTRHIILVTAAILALTAPHIDPAKAFDLEISGSVTQEIGVKITGKRNENNAVGNPYNGVAEPYRGLGTHVAPSAPENAPTADQPAPE